MRLAVALIATLSLLVSAQTAQADEYKPANKAEAHVLQQDRLINEYIDLGEYDAARDALKKHIQELTAAGSAVRPITAKTHALLGVVYVLGYKDSKAAKGHFLEAITIDKDIALPESANDRAKVLFGKAYEELHPTVDCDALVGVSHMAVPLAQEGKGALIEAKIDKRLAGSTMYVVYRGPKNRKYAELAMEKGQDCTVRAEIPADMVAAPKVEYYLEARLPDGRPSARRGKAKRPFVVNVRFGPSTDGFGEEVEGGEAKPTLEPVEDIDPVEPPKDEVEELLLTKPKNPKGSGCAGCQTEGGGGGSWLWVALGAVWLLRRRKQL